ncbi:hypothetical protein KC340_g13840 [Hortaea werneckii]|nr:hypothetical protein KC342_g15202 [Hortaea werneckii]KAI7099284.1 hypothetical protein KC339_g8318 [Hortaea werneckii]KAI7208767.1 hypothetical protein KC365_g15947 [Hortaea werneckii]KAI7299357.1 hypothetical protein KC340_g13840 [Hortaea werneckii]KAI7376898.1 hypothetical protein KC328_g14674 [Hortaea werneckii]
MYIDSKPASLYARTQDWKMPSPQTRGNSIKRPPILKNGSSSSSLRGMEQSVPSFQNFIKRTPPPDHLKPLPPTPLHPHQRASSVDSGISQCPSSSGRRSSSVYSRTVSQWNPEWDYQSEEVPEVPPLPDWRSADFADQDTNLLLRPIAYSASTSQLLEKNPQQQYSPPRPQLLEPRAYRPLIVTPSPTASASPSRATTPSPRPSESRASILLPPPPAPAHVPKKHLRTVSLEKAKELIHAPGAVHLLPEELRAQRTLTKKTTRSQEPMRMDSLDVFDAGVNVPPDFPASPPVLPTLIDEYGRERLLASPRESRVPLFSYELPSPPPPPPAREWKSSSFPFHAPEPLRTGHDRAASREKIGQTPRFDQMGEDRGRARIRGSRNSSYGNYIPSPGRGRRLRVSGGEDYEDRLARDDAQRIAQDYHILLKEEQQERYRQASNSPATSRGSETDDVRVQMKMVPQPLFHAKPSWSGGHFRRASNENDGSSRCSVRAESERTSPSRFHLRSGSGASISSSRGSSDGHGSFPLRLSTTPPLRRSRGSSTSGTIPISPPFAAAALPKKMSVVSAKALPLATRKKKERAVKNRWDESGENRVSMYYPHVMSRRTKKGEKKEGKGKEKKKGRKGEEAKKQEEVVPGVPLLAADIIAQRLETPETTPEASLRSDSASGRSAAVVEEKATLHQLVLKGAARYAEKLTGSARQAAGAASSSSASPPHTKQQSQYAHDDLPEDLHRIVSPESPHLLPSPSSGKPPPPPPIHLGWSAQSKSSFDRIRSPTSQQFPKQRQRSKGHPGAAAQGITHVQTPARPLNARIAGLKEESSSSEAGGNNGGNSGTKPAGILGGLMESWRESKAEKRREDLRKMIRVVTPVAAGGVGDGAAGAKGEGLLRRGSVGGANLPDDDDGKRPVGQMQRRLSAFSWM